MSVPSSAHVVIIGSGASGLASAACLARSGIPFTILEKRAVPLGGLQQIDPEMNLLSPEPLSRLPCMKAPRDESIGTYPKFRDFVKRLERFREEQSIRVEVDSAVTKVQKAPSGFEVTVQSPGGEERLLTGSHVINATGILSTPTVPAHFETSHCEIRTSHSLHVRTNDLTLSRRLLVVGGGASAAEVLDRWLELRRPDDVAWLSLRSRLKAVVSPVLGIDLHYLIWLPEHLPVLGFGHAIASLPEPMNGRHVLPAIRRGVIRRVGAVTDYGEREIVVDGDERLSPDFIVLATGFRYRTDHLGELVEHDEEGRPVVFRCESTRAEGLYLLGLRFGRTFASPYIRGIARDARFVAKRIAFDLKKRGER